MSGDIVITKYLSYKYLKHISYRKKIIYQKDEIYLAIVQSDGDNIQLNLNSLRSKWVMYLEINIIMNIIYHNIH